MSVPLTSPNSKANGASAQPSFSVILCVNRSNPWLSAAIESVLSQRDSDFEFLIAANACSDALWNELQELTVGDHRVRLVRTRIGQLAYNLNVLADIAHGEYLVRMDADDVCEPDMLTAFRAALSREPTDILGSAVILIDERDRIVGQITFPASGDEIKRQLAVRTVFCHPSTAIRRRFLIEQRGYLGGFASEDTDFWLRAVRAGASMRNLPEPLLRYRVHGEQSIASGRGYAEVAGHWMREMLLSPSWYSLKGLTFAVVKCLMHRRLPRAKRYYQGADQNSTKS